MDKNLATYTLNEVVSYYRNYNVLQKPEIKILEMLGEDLKKMSMLDIGIGGGRTTHFLCPLVKQYTGIDYSEKMVKSCIESFKGKFSNAAFYCEDARTLGKFPDNSFDFVLFSFNGIDYVNETERTQILIQINRVLKSGGVFCFSSHNITSLGFMPYFELRKNPFALLKRILDVRKIKKLNKDQLSKVPTSNYVIINDGAHNYGLQTFYIRQSYQTKQLENCGFSSVKVFRVTDGNEIAENNESSTEKEKWLYYLCRKN
ncbi:MAG: class I SAM-dependent methyltransferase [Bacteroidia bacterium]